MRALFSRDTAGYTEVMVCGLHGTVSYCSQACCPRSPHLSEPSSPLAVTRDMGPGVSCCLQGQTGMAPQQAVSFI